MPLDIFCQLYARVTVCLFSKLPLGLPPEIIDQLWIIQSLLMKPFWSFYSQVGVMELNRPPDVVNPLSVSIQPIGKKRLILYLRYINNFVIKHRVKYEDWKIALFYFQKGSFMITFDLKSAHHHIEIHSDLLRSLGFAWKFPGEASIRYFVFTVLPFGLSSAPYNFYMS